MTAELQGRTAFVTGGSRGIGRGIAIAMGKAGANVALTYRSEREKAQEVAQIIRRDGGQALALPMAVTDRAAVRHALDETERTFGALHILVNNAGINKPADFDQVTDADWDEVLAVNLKGPFICAQEALPRLARAGGGAIVNISSVSGQYGGPRTPHYAASKAGLISLGQVIARFAAKNNIRCNTVAAGLVHSDMASTAMTAPSVQAAMQNILLQRSGTPEEIADAVVFLASDRASYITGQTVNVNGGIYF